MITPLAQQQTLDMDSLPKAVPQRLICQQTDTGVGDGASW
jgi:hypothetical protein